MKLILKIAAGIILAVVLLIAGCSALIASSTDDTIGNFATTSENYDGEAASDEAASGDPTQSESSGQENARKSADHYLSFQAFSRKGLIEQLEYEGYSTADATYAVDALNADWNEQAALSAKHYLQGQSFSRQGLIDQLEYEGFTPSQAAYGVSQAY